MNFEVLAASSLIKKYVCRPPDSASTSIPTMRDTTLQSIWIENGRNIVIKVSKLPQLEVTGNVTLYISIVNSQPLIWSYGKQRIRTSRQNFVWNLKNCDREGVAALCFKRWNIGRVLGSRLWIVVLFQVWRVASGTSFPSCPCTRPGFVDSNVNATFDSFCVAGGTTSPSCRCARPRCVDSDVNATFDSFCDTSHSGAVQFWLFLAFNIFIFIKKYWNLLWF